MELLQEPAEQGEHAEGGSHSAPCTTPQVNPREHAHPSRGNTAGVCHGGRYVNHTSRVICPLGHRHHSLMSTFPSSIGFSCLPIVCFHLTWFGASHGSDSGSYEVFLGLPMGGVPTTTDFVQPSSQAMLYIGLHAYTTSLIFSARHFPPFLPDFCRFVCNPA